MVKRRIGRKSSRKSRGGVDEEPEYMKGYRVVGTEPESKTQIAIRLDKEYPNDYDKIGYPKGYDASKTIPQPSTLITTKKTKGGKRYRKSHNTRKHRK